MVLNHLNFQSLIIQPDSVGGRPDGRPDQGRSTRLVDRCARDVHKGQPSRPVNREVDRLKAPSSRVRPVDRAVDRRHNSQKSDCWPVDRVVDRQQDFLLSWTPMASFWMPINWGPLNYFLQDFKWVFKVVFPTLSSIYYHLF